MSSVEVKYFAMSNVDFKIRVSSVELKIQTLVHPLFCGLQVECRVSGCNMDVGCWAILGVSVGCQIKILDNVGCRIKPLYMCFYLHSAG